MLRNTVLHFDVSIGRSPFAYAFVYCCPISFTSPHVAFYRVAVKLAIRCASTFHSAKSRRDFSDFNSRSSTYKSKLLLRNVVESWRDDNFVCMCSLELHNIWEIRFIFFSIFQMLQKMDLWRKKVNIKGETCPKYMKKWWKWLEILKVKKMREMAIKIICLKLKHQETRINLIIILDGRKIKSSTCLFLAVIFYVSSAYFNNIPRSLSYTSDFRFVMRHDKGNLSVASSPHLPTHPQHPLAIWKLSVILQNALSLHRARSTRRPLLFLFFFFFHACPPASSPCPLPALCPRLSFSRIPHRITCYADTNHYYSQGRTDRRTDICKSRVMQYASARESEIDTHNQSAIDRIALTT